MRDLTSSSKASDSTARRAAWVLEVIERFVGDACINTYPEPIWMEFDNPALGIKYDWRTCQMHVGENTHEVFRSPRGYPGHYISEFWATTLAPTVGCPYGGRGWNHRHHKESLAALARQPEPNPDDEMEN